jgi:IPT/TIG domain
VIAFCVGCKAPVEELDPTFSISHFQPAEAFPKGTMSILGTNFNPIPKENKVFFGTIEAEVISSTSAHIEVIVPEGATTSVVSVEIAGERVTSEKEFVVLSELSISSVEPASASVGTNVTITGTSFSEVLTDNTVKFGELEGVVVSATKTSISVRVPEDAVNCYLSVSRSGHHATSPKVYLAIKPVISITTPTKGHVGTYVRIRGTSLDASSVRFGSLPAVMIERSKSELVVAVPVGVVSGDRLFIDYGFSTPLETNVNFQLEANWISKAPFPGVERDGPFCYARDGQIYFGLGTSINSGERLVDFWIYTHYLDSWRRLPDFPGEDTISHPAIAFIIYADEFGFPKDGLLMQSNSAVWLFSTWLHKWIEKKDFPGVPRIKAVGITNLYFDFNKSFVATGYDPVSGKSLKDVWKYDVLSDTWTQLGDFPGQARHSSVNFLNFLVGGETVDGTDDPNTYLFDAANYAWQIKSSSPVALKTKIPKAGGATAFAYQANEADPSRPHTSVSGIYVLPDGNVYKYEPRINGWIPYEKIPGTYGPYFVVGAGVSNKIIVITGNTVWEGIH